MQKLNVFQKIKILSLILIIIVPLGLKAQKNYKESNSKNTFDKPVKASIKEGVFDVETPLHFTLKFDITNFIKTKHEGEYFDAEIQTHYLEETVTNEIKLRARGNFRRSNCSFPPIQLNFKNQPEERKGFEEINKIKLVTQCRSTKKNENYVLKEYLVYMLYNIISDNSFRVRLIDAEYVDTGKKEKNYKQIGFLIEPQKLLAERLNYNEINEEIVKSGQVDQKEADILALFQYMIGNTDWRIKGGHNIKYIKPETDLSGKVSPVPYDFDFAGFVGTSYSHPQKWTNLKNVKDREYLGYCRTKEEYMAAIDYFKQKEDKISETIQNFTYLPEKDLNQLAKYIEEFFVLVNRPDRLITIMNRQCRDTEF